jgi:sulfate adenylyltransferase
MFRGDLQMTVPETIPPHGGKLVDLRLPDEEARAAADQAEHLPKLSIGRRELSDLELMAVGALSPLTGFMDEPDYRSVLEEMHLAGGLPWTIPVTFSVDEIEAKRIGGASRVALLSGHTTVAVLDIESVYRRDREKEAMSVFGTNDLAHPGVKALHAAGDYVVGGSVEVIRLPKHTTFQA